MRRRKRIDSWNLEKAEAVARRWRRAATAVTWLALGINSALVVYNALYGRLWLAGFSLAFVAFGAWNRAHAMHAHANLEQERLRSQVEIRMLNATPTEVSTERLLQDLNQLAAGMAFMLTSIIGQAMSEGMDVDEIIEASNAPPEMIRHYAKQAERGL